MNIPVPPTDNLYKFLAISGLLLVLLAYVVPTLMSPELEIALAETEGEQNALSLEVGFLKEDAKNIDSKTLYLEKQVKSAEERTKRLQTLPSNSRYVKELAEEELHNNDRLSSFLEELRHENEAKNINKREFLLKAEKLRTALAVQKVQEQSLRHLGNLLALGSFIGSIMAGFGFLFWYGRVQRLQDAVLKAEAQKSLSTDRARTHGRSLHRDGLGKGEDI